MFSYSTFSERSLTLCRWLAIITAIAAPISTAVTSAASVAMLLTWLASGEALRSLKTSAEQAAGKMLLLFFAWLLVGTLYADTNWADKVDTLSKPPAEYPVLWAGHLTKLAKISVYFCVIRFILSTPLEAFICQR